MTKLYLALAAGCLLIGSVFSCTETDDQFYEKGLAYLRKAQKPDGSYSSKIYGDMKSGISLTSLVVYTISLNKNLSDIDKKTLIKSVKYLNKGISKRGYVTSEYSVDDYANYSTALVLIASQNNLTVRKMVDHKKLVDFLLKMQLDEKWGWKESDEQYGGWGHCGGTITSKRFTMGTNISITSLVLESLYKEKFKNKNEVFKKANIYLKRCYNNESGGFCFTAETSRNFKAGWADKSKKVPVQYGCASFDGSTAVRSIGIKSGFDKRKEFLGKIKDFNSVYNLKSQNQKVWADSMYYYYLWSAARYYRDKGPKHTKAILEFFKKEQNADGSWANKSALMRENEPLIATCFALSAHYLMTGEKK